MACLGEGIANAIASRGDQAPAFTSNAEIEAEYFSPLLFETNAARRKLCAAVEQLGALLVDIPAEKILSISAKEFAEADLRDGADPAASFEECSELMERVVELFEEVRTCSANLRRACSKMMRIHILAHHTAGAGWNTVAQGGPTLLPRGVGPQNGRGPGRVQAPGVVGGEGCYRYAALQAGQAPH